MSKNCNTQSILLSLKQAIVVFFLLLVMGCDDAQNEFSRYRCFLIIDNSTHQNATLGTAMNQNAPGIFCSVSIQLKNGLNYFHVENSDGQSSDIPFDAIDSRRSFVVGQNNGVIVGFGAFSNPLTFYAYDRECPNCFSPEVIPVRSHPLSITSDGMATCKTCKRKYNMNSGGNIASGDGGNKLTRYHARTTGALGVLSVN